MRPIQRPFMDDLGHLGNLIQNASTRPVTAVLRSPFAVGLPITSLCHAPLILADHRIELFPLLTCGEKLILVASQKDIRLGTCQDDLWLFPWSREAQDWSVGAIERDMLMLLVLNA